MARFVFRGMISVLGFPTGDSHITGDLRYDAGWGYSIRCPIGTYTGRLRPNGVRISLVEVYRRVGKSVIWVYERIQKG